MSFDNILRTVNLTKSFGNLTANKKISIELKAGEIHGILGENGAGKSTLMNIIYGYYQPDFGDIYIKNKKVEFQSPKQAIRSGIGMVSQHPMLISNMSVLDNLVAADLSGRFFLKNAALYRDISRLCSDFDLDVNLKKKIHELPLGIQQKIELIKVMLCNPKIIILDEPTDVLTPQEAKALFIRLREFVNEHNAVFFISHKLDEVLSVTDRISVLRDGGLIITLDTKKTNAEELASLMVGGSAYVKKVKTIKSDFELKRNTNKTCMIEVSNLSVENDEGKLAVNNISFRAMEGEVFGIAGIEENGQIELVESLVGIRKYKNGKINIRGVGKNDAGTRKLIAKNKLGYIPQDRQREGLVMNFSVAENVMIETIDQYPFSRKGFVSLKAIKHKAQELIRNYDIRVIHSSMPVHSLSGGNQQKVILARVIDRAPPVVIAVNPTRGLDVNATNFVHEKLIDQSREKGALIILISADLDEMLQVCDRIAVIFKGKIIGIVSPKEVSIDEIGLMMGGQQIDAFSLKNI